MGKLTVATIDSDIIYLENIATLGEKIDFAWSTYKDKQNQKALDFLIYAFDIYDTDDINGQLIQLMADREQHKATNPEYIPGKSPYQLPFDIRTVIPERIFINHFFKRRELSNALRDKELLDVNTESKKLDLRKKTTFLSREQRAEHRVHISNGLFYKDGEKFDTRNMHSHDKKGFAAYTLNANGELSVFVHNRMRDGIAHSSMNAGAPVVAAGELVIEDGVLKALSTHSGHYQPSLFNVYRALEHFYSHGISIEQAKVVTFDNPTHKIKGVLSTGVYYYAYKDFMYETPATHIYSGIYNVLKENVKSIQQDVTSYGNRGSLLYKVKDALIRSKLTKKRLEIASNFENEIENFKTSLLHDGAPKNRDAKIKQLGDIITKYENKNEMLSWRYSKGPSSGRLAGKMQSYKASLAKLKSSSNKAPSDAAADSAEPVNFKSMKEIS